MTNSIVYMDHSEVRAGRSEELREAIRELAGFVEAHLPRLVAYQVHFGADDSVMTVLHVHRDAQSLDEFMRIAGPRFPKFAELVQLTRIEIHGEPSSTAMERIRAKAERLGGARVERYRRHAGFLRGP